MISYVFYVGAKFKPAHVELKFDFKMKKGMKKCVLKRCWCSGDQREAVLGILRSGMDFDQFVKVFRNLMFAIDVHRL